MLFRQGLLVSLMAHVILFKAVILTFSEKSTAPPPVIAFLGSILHDRDLFLKPYPTEDASVKVLRFNTSTGGEGRAPHPEYFSKPSYSPKTGPEPKIVVKPKLVLDERPVRDEDFEIPLTIDWEPPQYVPLKLDAR